MKNVLVIYYTQTGQLSSAVRATLAPLENDASLKIHYAELLPVMPYPYPWTYMQFFDVFPETVHGIPCKLKEIQIDPSTNYDLVVIAYQPWYLSICIPVNSFLLSEQAKLLLKDKPVITIIACRNMWLGAQEKMKLALNILNAKLVGNITYVDRSANLVSLITVLAFVLAGKKENFLGIFPKYGVSDKDLKANAPVFGGIIKNNLQTGDYGAQQAELVSAGAVVVKPNLMLMEGRGRALFPLYANYISKRGTAGSSERRARVRIFGIVLPTAILLLSPVITIVSRLAPLLFPSRMKKQVDYYSQNSLKS
ncbi:MAG: dialkylresorcinol condensing enzyme DarA [Bacteroidota bacterium]|nr:dialkylresorcinol condensing enzyme DarA [Bacteroidota bacterium]